MFATVLRARLHSDERGAAAVEFALVVSILVMLVFGIIEFGRAFNELEVMNAAAREGARAAAVGATDVEARIVEAAAPYTPDLDDFSLTPAGGCAELGEPVAVSWTQDIDIAIPLLPSATKSVEIRGVFRCEVGADA